MQVELTINGAAHTVEVEPRMSLLDCLRDKLMLNGAITDRGVLMPLKPVIYDPILDELEQQGIIFQEQEVKG